MRRPRLLLETRPEWSVWGEVFYLSEASYQRRVRSLRRLGWAGEFTPAAVWTHAGGGWYRRGRTEVRFVYDRTRQTWVPVEVREPAREEGDRVGRP